ncbi:MAG: LPS export ABC transporter periplasmic protein LptC [Gammaproteobacteria bacterium]|jgi:LPS export ABC transporter protein LptC|nr:LPS export ABC transporter periplasmic protein LptC [Gammaproteobacteria bacterium]MBT5203322.1 LPS export ABC transporter periplasmic protein LptC [Gammaproteobacteria bacterium]MBT5600633.1 LPS export ABC transporter periplasmic protein LptC [Gammaproteobacteria bacterium]MBT6244574.1 LPS export ABC transporter periplasmic protein LptC [Gammaproteobacteria bacterium]
MINLPKVTNASEANTISPQSAQSNKNPEAYLSALPRTLNAIAENINLRGGLLFSTFIITSGLLFHWILNSEESTKEREPMFGNQPDLYLLNASISQFNQQGNLDSVIAAQKFTHYPLTDVTTLKQPNVRLYSLGNSQPWNIVSENGRLLSLSEYRQEVVELWDGVQAARFDGNQQALSFQTENLLVYPGQHLVKCDQKVVISNATSETTAAGMQARFDIGRFKLYSSENQRVVTKIFSPSSATEI